VIRQLTLLKYQLARSDSDIDEAPSSERQRQPQIG